MTTAQTQTERQTPVYKQRILWTILSITSTAFTRNRIQYCYIFKMFKVSFRPIAIHNRYEINQTKI